MMTVRFCYAPDGAEISEVIYTLHGKTGHARLYGWLSPAEAAAAIGLPLLKLARKV